MRFKTGTPIRSIATEKAHNSTYPNPRSRGGFAFPARLCGASARDVDRQLDSRAAFGQSGRERTLGRAGLVRGHHDRRVSVRRAGISKARVNYFS